MQQWLFEVVFEPNQPISFNEWKFKANFGFENDVGCILSKDFCKAQRPLDFLPMPHYKLSEIEEYEEWVDLCR